MFIGQKPITDFNIKNNVPSYYCTQAYDRARKATLRAHPWNFAFNVKALALSSEDPEFGYTYRYQMPDMCLKPIVITNSLSVPTELHSLIASGNTAFMVYQKNILTNIESAKLAYTEDIEDPNKFTDDYRIALAYLIAAFVVMPLAKNVGLQQNMIAMYRQSLATAKGVDASENRTTTADTGVSVR